MSRNELAFRWKPVARLIRFVRDGALKRIGNEFPGLRFRPYSYADLRERDKTGLDIFWLSDSSLAGADSALAPKVIAREIADEIRAALQEFDAIAEALPDNEEADGANPADEETA